MDVRLGAFTLERPLARGGMGSVWAARHTRQGTPVAIKLLAQRDPRVVEALQAEIRAVAALSHPHIVHVFDQGVVPDGVGAEGVAPGTPWLAMELCDGGTLRQLSRRLGWGGIRRVLLDLLDALAHAHARGVLHRDLKPGNVLVGGAHPGLKLADFGLVHRLDERGAPLAGGTPAYIAPEQIAHDVDAQGPWTDLYSLACVAWLLVTGRHVFRARGPALLAAHAEEEPGTFAPRLAVPDGLEGWLRALLRKDPSSRFQRAADAAWALLALPSRGGPEPGPDAPLEDLPSLANTLSALKSSVRPPPMPGPAPPGPPPLPEDGRRGELPRSRPELLGAGAALFGLRPVPLVGRAAEQDALWALLRRVHGTRHPAVATVSAAEGGDAPEIARWLLWRAHELGAAITLRLHAEGEGFAEALGQRDVGGGLIALRDAAGARAAVVWVEDAHASPAGVALARAALRSTAPVLVLLTASDDGLHADPDLDDAWQELGARGFGLHLEPLGAAHRVRLVRQLLGLEPTLAAWVEDRCGGSTRFAVQLVAHWIATDALEEGDDGFRLRSGASRELPEGWAELAEARLGAVLDEHPAWAEPLERAALLGAEVVGAEWQAVAGPLPPALLPALLVSGLAAVVPGTRGLRWQFAHPGVRRAAIGRATRAGRLKGHHGAVAAHLQARGTEADRGRLGVHLARSGAGDAALGPLLDGAGACVDGARDARALALVAEARAVLGDREVGTARYRIAFEEGRALRSRGDLDAAEARLEAARAWAEERGDAERLAESLVALSVVEGMRGRPEHGLARLERAAELAHGAAPHLAATARIRAGFAYKQLGRHAEAIGSFEAARTRLTELGDRFRVAWADSGMASSLVALGRWEEAEQRLLSSIAALRALGAVNAEGNVHNDLGEVYRRRGDLERAEVQYTEAVRCHGAAASSGARLAVLNLAIVQALRGRNREARDAVTGLLPDVQHGGGVPMLVEACWSVLALATAGLGDWESCGRALDGVDAAHAEGDAEPDVAMLLDRAAELAEAGGAAPVAERARRSAEPHRRR